VLGFGLENYDAIGKWRTMDGKVSGRFERHTSHGKSFSRPGGAAGPSQGELPEFSRCLIEKMLTYSLGRGLERYDTRTVDEINRKLEASGYRFPDAHSRDRRQCSVPIAARRNDQDIKPQNGAQPKRQRAKQSELTGGL